MESGIIKNNKNEAESCVYAQATVLTRYGDGCVVKLDNPAMWAFLRSVKEEGEKVNVSLSYVPGRHLRRQDERILGFHRVATNSKGLFVKPLKRLSEVILLCENMRGNCKVFVLCTEEQEKTRLTPCHQKDENGNLLWEGKALCVAEGVSLQSLMICNELV